MAPMTMATRATMRSRWIMPPKAPLIIPTSQSTSRIATSVQSIFIPRQYDAACPVSVPSPCTTNGVHDGPSCVEAPSAVFEYVNALLLASLIAFPADRLFEIDLTKAESFQSYDGVRPTGQGLALAPQPGKWTELFRGRPEFGLITGVFAMRDRLLFLDSPLPAGSDGGEVYIWDPVRGQARRVLQVAEQGVVYIRGNAGSLFIPGPDATESWDFGNVYRSMDAGDHWTKLRTVPNAVHVWDLGFWRGGTYACTGSVKNNVGYAAVLQSQDAGKSWREVLVAYPPDRKKQFARFYALIPLKDALYASFAVIDKAPSKPGPKSSFDFYKFDGKRWSAVSLAGQPLRSPYFGLRHRDFEQFSLIGTGSGAYRLAEGRLTPVSGLEGLAVFDFERTGEDELYAVATDPRTKQSAIYGASFKAAASGDAAFEKLHPLPDAQEGLALRGIMRRLYVGTKATGGGRLLAEANAANGAAITAPVKLMNEGRVFVRLEGDRPEGSEFQVQIRASRNQSELERAGGWPRPIEDTGGAVEVRGIPRGEAWIQLRLTMRGGGPLTSPLLRRLKIETRR